MKKKVELLADCIREPQVLAKDFHRPQTKFAKVMFSQVFVFPGGGVLVSVQGALCLECHCLGGLCPGKVSVRGVSVQEDPLYDK